MLTPLEYEQIRTSIRHLAECSNSMGSCSKEAVLEILSKYVFWGKPAFESPTDFAKELAKT